MVQNRRHDGGTSSPYSVVASSSSLAVEGPWPGVSLEGASLSTACSLGSPSLAFRALSGQARDPQSQVVH
jgi:hypothetical protein